MTLFRSAVGNAHLRQVIGSCICEKLLFEQALPSAHPSNRSAYSQK